MKNIKTKNINKRSNNFFYKKIFMLTLVFSFSIYILNWIPTSHILTDISELGRWLLTKQQILENIENIKDNKTIWPVSQVIDRGKVTDYNRIRDSKWDTISDNYKTTFPSRVSDIIERYRYVSPYNIWETITNPHERENVLFHKRLITTLWTSSYNCNSIRCDWRVPDTWTHAWIDIVSSIWTPVYSSMNGIVMRSEETRVWFWNYVIILTNFNWELLATFYAHLDNIDSSIRQWQIIKRWDKIWTIWNTWCWWRCTAPHLHFQINYLWKISDIQNINIAEALWNEWQNWSIQWIKNSTLNPITFIENNLITVPDSLVRNDNNPTQIVEVTWNEDEVENENINEDNSSNQDIIQEIARQLENEYNQAHSSAWEEELVEIKVEEIEPLKIISVRNPKIDDKLSLWDLVELTINTNWSEWIITVSSNNNVLKPQKYTINTNSYNENYNILVSAENIWNWRIIISDWNSNRDFYFSVYDEKQEVVWLWIDWSETIYTSTTSKYTVYPIDSLWNTVNYNLNWRITITLLDLDNNTSHNIIDEEIRQNSSVYSFEIKAPNISNYRVRVRFQDNDKNISTTKNLKTEVFTDYSNNSKFWNSMIQLNNRNIVQWHQWKLMPNNKIIRAELITILVRERYWDKFEEFKNEMNEYISRNWNFFVDIDPNEWYAPYIYIWFRDWVIKWAWWTHAMPNSPTQKDELIAIYARFYNISKNDQFPSFLDVTNNDWFANYVSAAKAYNLYPFDNKDYFNPWEHVTREYAFESLYRYMTTTPIKTTTSTRTQENELEDAIKALLNF